MKPPCVILAGGRSSRMGGGDKCLLPLHGKPILAHLLDSIAPQVSRILLNCNGETQRFSPFGLPVRTDAIPGSLGPLAGLLTGMLWAQGADHVLSVPCDTPFLPTDLTERLAREQRRTGADIAIACDAERDHPVIGLWPVALAGRLTFDLEHRGIRAIHKWLGNFQICKVAFDAMHLCNLNTRTDLDDAQMHAACHRDFSHQFVA